jgi:hypothetical protein
MKLLVAHLRYSKELFELKTATNIVYILNNTKNDPYAFNSLLSNDRCIIKIFANLELLV